MFIAIGHTPATELFAGQARDEADGYVVDRAQFDRDLGARRCSPPATSPTTSTARR